jgi:hypothetical protein
MKQFLVALALAISSGSAHAGVAFLETSRGDGQWIVASSPDELTALADQWSASVSHFVGAKQRLRCDEVGWAASFYDGQNRTFGAACGYGSRDEAERAASGQCRDRGGQSCRRVFSGYDDGSWTDPRPGGGHRRLKDFRDD